MPKNKLHRLPVRLLAAAATLAVLTVSAFAVARALGAGDLMAGLFEDWGRQPLNVTQVEMLNGMGHVFDGSEQFSVTSGGATITPVSALADEDCYYLHLRIETPEGLALPDLDGTDKAHYAVFGDGGADGIELGVAYDSWAESGRGAYHSARSPLDQGLAALHDGIIYGCATLPDADPADNVKDVVLTIFSNTFGDIRWNDGRDKQLLLKGLWVRRFDEALDTWVATPVFRGTFKLDIGAHFESQVAAIDCAGVEWTDPDSGQINRMDAMKLSPLGLKFEFHTNVREDNDRVEPYIPGDVRVVMKDGSEISFTANYSIYLTDEHQERSDPYFQVAADMLTQEPEWARGSYAEFGTPIDLTQVDYVQFDEDHIYPIRAD